VLTTPEKAVFILAVLISSLLALRAINRLRRVIFNNEATRLIPRDIAARSLEALVKTITQRTVFRSRPLTSFWHALIAWGFMFYLLVNVGDILQGFIPNYSFLRLGFIGNSYRLLADVLSIGVLVGITALLARRFIARSTELTTRGNVLLHRGVHSGGIRRDSAIVGGFILLHVGARFLGESFKLAATGSDWWQPSGNMVARLWAGGDVQTLNIAHHVSWWLALGLILIFVPYFPYTKHIHIFFAPLNFVLKPRRRSLGEMIPLSLETDGAQLGAARLEDLPWPQLMDAYACIQCNRCQDVCPAYLAGATLSPAALEINKRYELNEEADVIAAGQTSQHRLLDFAIKEDAVWACTSCGACVEICPVGNEPLRDILDIRRNLTLVAGELPQKGGAPLRNIAVLGNPWGGDPSERMAWADGLNLKTLKEVRETDVLYWVGCSSAYETRNKSIAQSVTRLLQKAGVDFAVLGNEEGCTGDPARRLGDEALFQKMARRNIEVLSKYSFNSIVTHCSHCFNVLKNEYPPLLDEEEQALRPFSNWKILHHTQLLSDLVKKGRLEPVNELNETITFHDSCYLGRYNNEFDAPRELLAAIPGVELKEMPRSRERGLCCGGGGGCSWVDVPAEKRVADIRMEEALSLKSNVIVSACPFCLTMFEGSALASPASVRLKDVAELLDESTSIRA
jgi:Fe-S oxidoreductase